MQSEFEFINNLKTRYSLSKVGDDAAVLPKDDKHDLVISTDMLVEDIDFRLDWSTPSDIGHKSLAVSLSDIAAMGATPIYSLVSIGVAQKIWENDFTDQFYQGYMEMAHTYEVELIGGDISETPKKTVIDSTVIGVVEKGKAILRSTAQIGDLIYVTGNLGSSAVGLKCLEYGVKTDTSKNWQSIFISKHLRPHPYFQPQNSKKKVSRETELINKFATSMIDLSDGLSSDLSHICRSSKVGAKIYADNIPIHQKLLHLSDKTIRKFSSENLDILDIALHGGEDFELLFTVNPSNSKNFEKKNSGSYTHIGEITEDTENIELIRNNRSDILQPKGYQHF